MLTPLTSDDPHRIGPFRLANRIGAGGMGVVYLGFGEDGKPAAVKVPSVGLSDNPEFRSRFQQEVAAARRVRGTSVAAVLDADLTGERQWMATEFVEGRSLGDAVATRGALDDRLVHGLAIGLADALVDIHAAGVVHRDLKPANILLAWDGPKVIDFGIARAADSTSHTRTGMLIGTLVWMAPEQLRGDRAGPPADIFAWGACVAFGATGHPPFRGERAEAIGMQILTAEPDLDGVPADLAGLVHAALDKEPARRPTAHELLTHLVGRDTGGASGADQASETALARVWSLPPTPPTGAPPLRDRPGSGPAGTGRRAASTGPDPTARDPRAGYDDPRRGAPGYGADPYGDQGRTGRGGYPNQSGYAGQGYDTSRYGGSGYDERSSGPGAGYPDQHRTPGHGGGHRDTPPGARPGGDNRRGLVVAAVLVAVLLLGGVAVALALSKGSGDGGGDATAAPGSATASVTADPSSAGGGAVTTGPASATPSASPTTSSPSPSPSATASPTQTSLSASDARATVTSRGYTADMSTYQEGRRLNVVIGTGTPNGDTPTQLAFIFADGQFRGTDTKDPSAHVTVYQQNDDHNVTLRYDTYNPGEAIGSPSGHADIRFRWTGSNFTTLDPIPVNDPAASGSRR